MPLIKSISGFRGTIGGKTGDNLTPPDVVSCCAGFGSWIGRERSNVSVVIGRDARISGSIVHELCVQTLLSLGIDVIDLGLSTTPTVAMTVQNGQAEGGIIITASHNPEQWNALKFLNAKGEFISAEAGKALLKIVDNEDYFFADVNKLGKRTYKKDAIKEHVEAILALNLVNLSDIRKRKFRIIVDCVNSTGGIALAPLLSALGCEFKLINDDMSGRFSHNPEPLPKHLHQISTEMTKGQHDLGIVVDPDVDRLVFVCEDGSMFGEEYTIVALADFILQHEGGATVSNLSSTQALKDVTLKHGHHYYAAAVGEVNVVSKMKEVNAVFGGEGNGGVIYPALHFGRDALVGVALMLSYLGEKELKMTQIRADLPQYIISKQKVSLGNSTEPDHIIDQLKARYSDIEQDTVDGLKLIFNREWVHMRKSNTEPIIRIYAESKDKNNADELAMRFVKEITELDRSLS